ncbi:MAG: DUF1015 family protein [Kiritimatiellia bacterium]|nr:DUF1015 family protein [Kiritimatiellia bacterium]
MNKSETLRIKSFCALRPRRELCAQVASVPYDVVDRDEALALARDNPFSFLHVSRSEIDLPENTNPYSAEVYAKATSNFAAMQERGILIRDAHPSVYIYRLKRNSRYQHGIVACCHVKDYENNIIKKHEKTRIDKEEDRKQHTAALRAHSGPVFLTYRDNAIIDGITLKAEKQEPLYDFVAPDGIGHTVWSVPDTDSLIKAFREVPAAYIADGHHRAAAGVRVANELSRTAGSNENEEFNWFLAVLFPAGQLEILPYNRCVHDLGGMASDHFLEEVKKRFTVERNAQPTPLQPGRISMYLGNSWFSLTPHTMPPPKDIVARLDVSILQADLFEPILGIKDPRTDKRLEFIGGIHGPQELERRVNAGKAAVAFSMYPATVNQLMAISDASQSMPPKSTWFEPKLRDALLIHTF